MKNKNYLSIFSKEDIETYIYNTLPKCVDLVSEKKRTQIKETLKFMILPPNTILVNESDDEVPICYSVVSGEIRVFKKDPIFLSTIAHEHEKEEF